MFPARDFGRTDQDPERFSEQRGVRTWGSDQTWEEADRNRCTCRHTGVLAPRPQHPRCLRRGWHRPAAQQRRATGSPALEGEGPDHGLCAPGERKVQPFPARAVLENCRRAPLVGASPDQLVQQSQRRNKEKEDIENNREKKKISPKQIAGPAISGRGTRPLDPTAKPRLPVLPASLHGQRTWWRWVGPRVPAVAHAPPLSHAEGPSCSPP